MAYLSPSERLSEALDRVMAADGRSKEQAQTDICVAIAGRTINFQAKLRRHETKPLRDSVSILEGRDFHIPHKIKPEDLDWEQSRPLKPWPVKREDHIIHGRWYLEWIELCREEVSKVLCGGDGASGRARQASTATAGQETAAIRALALHLKGSPQLTRADAAKWCRKNGYNLSDRGFQYRVWPRAREDAGLESKAAPGRKRKSSH